MEEQRTHTVITAPGQVYVDPTNLGDKANSVAMQADGKILVAGFSTYVLGRLGDSYEEHETRDNYSVIRLNTDGTLDTTFGEDGVVMVQASVDQDQGIYMTVQPDGHILSAVAGPLGVRVQRFNEDGVADTSFGGTGVVDVDIPPADNGGHITVNPDGTLYITGMEGDYPSVAKLNADGSLATEFGENGKFTFTGGGEFIGVYNSTTVQPDGSFLFGGNYSAMSDYSYSIVRVSADGELDTSFADNGTLVFEQSFGLQGQSAVTVQPDGKIIVAGTSTTYDAATVVRLNADGSFDTSFGDNGVVHPALGANEGYSARGVTVQEDGKIVVVGQGGYAITRLNADGSLDTTFGSQDGNRHIDGWTGADNLIGNDQAEIIKGLGGDDVLQGNGGRDVLIGGTGADIFRFDAVGDSFRTGTTTGSDRIVDFDATQDRIDLIGLGFTGLGNGLDGTLSLQVNAEGTRTYLKNFETNAQGQRFELVLEGNYLDQLNTDNLVFEPVNIKGTAGAHVINGSAIAETIQGLGGNDHIYGGGGDDVIQSGAGRDILDGGEGADTFLYTSIRDSYRTATDSFSDVIENFDKRFDHIDVSALGFTGFGDGTGDTLKLSYNTELGRTYLKNYETNDLGQRFELTLDERWPLTELQDTVIFAPQNVAAASVEVELIGAQSEPAQDWAFS
ncbi:calcium-binding protein [Pseudomonas sp. CDFA 553]|uniref:M10 family metallopeptidase C-terminal domain-containing protein n=1 Tax=Pseudomonas quasicaspiana TaxID=2829821 RepID=UPI00222866B3|nr:calcium-binding protein [Pseudomonas quasicaspiana]MCD5987917.1 calcium-binding protein [Pseudomonas quasicaspiana]